MGKPLDESVGEVDFSAAIYDYYADNAEKFLADEPIDLLDGEGTALIRRSSVGVLLGIMPWNYPYYQVARFAGPNLALGNTIVLKHAPQCPESAAAMQQIFADAGFPEGAYVNVYATNEQIADVIADPRVQGVSLTGSERAGAAVAEIAGRNLKKVVLELGGSDPFIVLGSDDLDATVDAAVAAGSRTPGRPATPPSGSSSPRTSTTTSSTSSPRRCSARPTAWRRCRRSRPPSGSSEQVKRAVADGATLVTDGERNGAFFPPGVLTDVSPDSTVLPEELFGPVAMVYKVGRGRGGRARQRHPVRAGLLRLHHRPRAGRARRRQIDAGMVFVNGVGAEGVELPFGGVKRSGFGRELGRYGIDEFVNKKLIRIAG